MPHSCLSMRTTSQTSMSPVQTVLPTTLTLKHQIFPTERKLKAYMISWDVPICTCLGVAQSRTTMALALLMDLVLKYLPLIPFREPGYILLFQNSRV